ncbi:C40 family peptidase [Streptomyces similanensis]|uniref:NlpC/P60 domain-containing protein n=1 Tax=Streptomyces similanensis TaxID=1274988 RepID=A0ABP9LRL8_9ACTN
MASHRKPVPTVPHATAPAAPAAPAAPVPVPSGPVPAASVALVPQGVQGASLDAPGGTPSPEEVERKIDELYRRADSHGAAENRNGTLRNGTLSGRAGGRGEESGHGERGPGGGGRGGAGDERGGGGRGEAETARDGAAGTGERGARQRGRGAALRDGASQRADMLTRAREMLSAFTAAPYRPAPSDPDAAALLLADAPRGYFEQAQLMSRLTARQKVRAGERAAQRPPAAGQSPSGAVHGQRVRSGPSAAPRYDIRAAKTAVQRKLATARALVEATGTPPAPLTTTTVPVAATALAPTDAHVTTSAAVPTNVQVTTAAAVPTDAPVTFAADAPVAVMAPDAAVAVETPAPLSAAVDEGVRRDGAPSGAEAHKALAFARAQIGKPYVWGAAGPGSYDCSGLTQAAWKAAGVALPRSLRDQSRAGTTVPAAEALPGDLVFFHDSHGEVGHVGVYAGHGMMIHAPEPGAYVREDPVRQGGAPAVHHVVRPA